jgi:hypothetical protein
MTGYKIEIREASEELTKKQKIMLKDTTGATKLDVATQEAPVIINPAMWAVLAIHNEKSSNPDYENYIVVDKDGSKYVTGSESFWDTFYDIWSDMQGEEEEWSIRVYRSPSKNYSGKDFITCSIV